MTTEANRSTSEPGGVTRDAVLERVRRLVDPIVTDLKLDLYDLEQRGGTLRVTIDTPPGSDAGVDLDTLALATRLVSRELDHNDPIPGRYTLEVTSPGLERALRTPAHFRREVGKDVAVRLRATAGDDRRLTGVLVAADDAGATLRVTDPDSGEPVDRHVPYDRIDRARTVFEWGPAPKPGGPKKSGKKAAGTTPARTKADGTTSTGEHRSGGPTHKEEHPS